MSWSLSFEPLFGWTWLALAGLALAVLAGLGLWMRSRGAAIRAAAGALLVLALANPVVVNEIRNPLPSTVALVVDRSQSNRLSDRKTQTDGILDALRSRFATLPQFELREIEASTQAGENPETRLNAATHEALRDVAPGRVGGAIWITDGQIHDLPETSEPMLGAPVHVLVTGEPDEQDRRVSFVVAPRFAIVGKPVDFTYRVDEDGPANGEEVEVTIRLNGAFVATDIAAPGEIRTITVELPNAGRNVIEIEAAARDNEMTPVNNNAVALVDGIRENLRVLLISGEPHAGERTWRNLLKSDASVDLVHFTILRPPEKQDGTPINELSLIAFPTRELFVEKINDFDLIIFDRYQHRNVLPVLYYDYIARYVEEGGALLVAAGPEFSGENSIAQTPLFPALPALPTGEVVEAGFHPRLTEQGNRHPVTRALEGSADEPPHWSRWFRQVMITPPKGDVVMSGMQDAPLLVLNRYGEGRIAMLMSDQAWLWARGFEGGGPHVALYRRMAHWLMKEPELEEERLMADGRGDRLTIVRQSMADTPDPVTITAPDGTQSSVRLVPDGPGRFSATAQTDQIGLFSVSNGDLSTLAHVGPVNSAEWQAVVASTEVSRQAVEATGGSVRFAGGSANLPSINPVRGSATASGNSWIGLRVSQESALASVSRLPLFSGLLGLALLLGGVGLTWWREGR